MPLATNNTPARCCLVIQQQLENMLRDKAPGAITEETGVINALISSLNTAGFEAVQTNAFPGKGLPTNGQSRPEVEIRFEKPVCGDVAEGQLELCDTQEKEDPIGYRRFEIPADQAINSGFQIEQSDFDRICEGRDERVAQMVIRKAKQLRYALEKRIIQLFAARVGNYVNGANSLTNPKILNLFTVNSNGAYANPNAFIEAKSQYRRMHTMTAPIIVGDDEVARWFDSRRMGGLGQNALFANPNDFGGFTPATSLFLNQVINGLTGNPGERNAISWLPGTAQLITWNKYVGDREIARDDYFKSTIVIDGLRFDYTLNYDKCFDKWDIGLGLTYDLFNLNNELAPCYDFNYLLRWLVDCGEDTCDNLLGDLDSESVVN
jgi:hypothetical protein